MSKYLKKKSIKILSQEEFFERVSNAAGYMDPETIRLVYNSMLRVIYDELRTIGFIRLPALCDFRVLLSSGKRIKNRHMDSSIVKKPFHQIRIQPVDVVRQYFKALDERLDGKILDPAEKQ